MGGGYHYCSIKLILLKIAKYTPESVIINFYHKKSYMTGHLDDGEKD